MNEMQPFFEKIYGYHHHLSKHFMALILEKGNEFPQKGYDLFCHMINAQRIWNKRIAGDVITKPFEVHTPEVLDGLINEVNAQSLHIIRHGDMHRIIHYSNTMGETFANSVEDILYHVANHHSHHRGQITALLRNQGWDPPVTDYIFYRRDKDRN